MLSKPRSEPPFNDEYLGDGVYASYDGYHIILDLREQDRITQIALDPSVFRSLVEYKKKMDNIVNEVLSNADES